MIEHSPSCMKHSYLHGYTQRERKRLIDQAIYLKDILYRDIRFPARGKILEVGCGVGGQMGILHQHFPKLNLFGVDLSFRQLAGARSYLQFLGIEQPNLVYGNAKQLPFPDACFDGIFTCWFFEHVSGPLEILKECRRILKPKKQIYLTEVENNSVCIWPESKPFRKFWNSFNKTQLALKGDPFVGKKLYPLLKTGGFSKIEVYPITFHFNRGSRQELENFVLFFYRICKSALKQILQRSPITEAQATQALEDFRRIPKHPEGLISFTCYRGIGFR